MFLSFLFSSMNNDEEIEHIQVDLQYDQTFSVGKLFRFFDINNDRKIQFEDFVLTLQKLDVLLKKEELL